MCKCCEEVRFIKEDLIVASDIRRKIETQLIIKDYRKGQRKPAGTITFNSYDLSYCPMCGKKL